MTVNKIVTVQLDTGQGSVEIEMNAEGLVTVRECATNIYGGQFVTGMLIEELEAAVKLLRAEQEATWQRNFELRMTKKETA